MIPEQIKKFIEVFSRLPSIGPRLATRLAFYLLELDKTERKELEDALAKLNTLDRCPRCFFLKSENKALCDICANPNRDKSIIAIVEKETDIISLERAHRFNGHYLIIGELPDKGTLESVHKLRIQHLKSRIENELGGSVKELIIALNPTTFGDFVASIIKQDFRNLAKQITRLGRGIPTGGEIEFADEETLGSALERRM
ncbi:MAG: toprim domain-containing protein [bacterium]|nr:toprim domain-containing protein [Candidatus Jorgensenbacteria bacterium]